MLSLLQTCQSYICGGVDFQIPGNGGPTCYNSLPLSRRLFESIVIVFIATLEIYWSSNRINGKEEDNKWNLNHSFLSKYFHQHTINWMKKVVLAVLLLVFTAEIVYKVTEGSVIYLLNPCHITTFFQIYFLISDNTKNNRVKTLFRIHIHLISGALLAILLPVTNTRVRYMEVESYWMHHFCIYFVVPLFLLAIGGNYTTESLHDKHWWVLSAGYTFLYHFVILQSLALISQVNLNNMLCPAVSDPFAGVNYRIWASLHQHLLIFLHAKLYQIFAYYLLKSIEMSFKLFLSQKKFNEKSD